MVHLIYQKGSDLPPKKGIDTMSTSTTAKKLTKRDRYAQLLALNEVKEIGRASCRERV